MNEFFNPHPHNTSRMLGLGHILSMVICFSIVIVIGYLLRNISSKKRRIIYQIIAIITLVLDPIYLLWEYFVTGTIHVPTSLPLYYCSIFILAAPVFAFSKPGSKINLLFRNYILTMNIICAVFGLVFLVHLNKYRMFHFVVIRSFFFHYLMVLMPSIIYFGEKPKLKLFDCFSFLIPASFIFIPAFIIDKVCGYDYCYFNGGRGTPVFMFAGKINSYLLFFLILLFFLVVTNLLINLPRYISKKYQFKIIKRENKEEFAEKK